MAATDDGVADGTPAPAEPEERASTTAAAIDDVKAPPPFPGSNAIEEIFNALGIHWFDSPKGKTTRGGVTIQSQLVYSSEEQTQQDIDEIMHRINKLEETAGVDTATAGVTSRDIAAGDNAGGAGSPVRAQFDPVLDPLFKGIGAKPEPPPDTASPDVKEANDDDSEDEEAKPTLLTKLCNIPNPCTLLWGGPYQATYDDNLYTYFERFTGYQGAGAINHFFDDGGPIRKLFWFGIFISFGYLGAYYCIASIQQFLEKGVETSVGTTDHDGTIPEVSVCMSSPIRCTCEAFYDSAVLEANFAKIVPYLCKEVLVYLNKDSMDPANPPPDLKGIDPVSGERNAFTVYDNAAQMIDKANTLAKIAQLRAENKLVTSDCDSGSYTKDWFIKEKVAKGDLSYMDLIMYAGYTRRTQIVKECMVIDPAEESPTLGQKLSCMGPEWWSDMWVDDKYGACHTFNPCYGLPVGKECEEDSECSNELNFLASSKKDAELPAWAKVGGGYCDKVTRTCACSKCQHGKDCKLAVQTKSGKGNGLRLILNSAVGEDTPVTSAENGRWSPGVVVHMHSEFDKGLLSQGLIAAPGKVVDATIQKAEYTELKYPWTNCSMSYNTDRSLCRANCLRRVQAIECCGQPNTSAIIKGHFSQKVNYSTPSSGPLEIDNPVLACNFLKDGFRTCMKRQQKKYQDGEICLDGALSLGEEYAFTIIKNVKKNSYADQSGLAGGDYPGVSSMEEKSIKIKNHCVWSETENAGAEAFNSARLGKECDDASDCKTSLGEDGQPGRCEKAYRAYCPERCSREDFKFGSVSTAPISKSFAALIANREISFVTKQQFIQRRNPALKAWKPLCVANPSYVNASSADPEKPETWKYKGIPYIVADQAGCVAPAKCTNADTDPVGAGDCSEGGTNATCLANTNADVFGSANDECMTEDEGKSKVLSDYTIVRLNYLDFEAITNSKEDAMPIPTLLGVLGGNLGLFLGFTMMTFVEWIECAVFFALGALWLILRLPLLPFVRSVPPAEDSPYEDEDVQKVLGNMKKIAEKRKEASDVKVSGSFWNNEPF